MLVGMVEAIVMGLGEGVLTSWTSHAVEAGWRVGFVAVVETNRSLADKSSARKPRDHGVRESNLPPTDHCKA